MSKRRKRPYKPIAAVRPASQSRPSTGGGGPEPPRARTGRLYALLGVVALTALAALLVVARRTREGTELLVPLPMPAPHAGDTLAIAATDFVGSPACASCHADQYAAWSRSTHARAGGAPGSVRVLAPFDGQAIRFRDAEVIPAVRGGAYTFTVRRPGERDLVLRVDGVVGGGHMQGGGTQGFVTRWTDGTVRFLPFDYIRGESLWFCNTTSRAGRGWVPIGPELALADCGDWPPIRVLGDDVRFANCQSCHGSQIRLALDTSGAGYRTSYASLGINCESCHGPGRAHLAAVRDSASRASGALAIGALGALDTDASLGTCWQCHAVKDQLRPGFVSGQSLEAYYSIHLAQLGDAAHYPDGRVRTFAYQQGHLYSDCYVNGGMTCTSCHDPHDQSYRDVRGVALSGRFDDAQCTACHASKAEQPERHTRHNATSSGSRCTACHMPYLQQREVGSALRYARSDHAIPIPRPLADSSLGVESACKGCHGTWSERALDDTVRAWYGELKPRNPTIEAVLAWRDDEPLPAASTKLLDTTSTHVAAQVAGLARFIESYATLDTADIHAPTLRRLQALGSRGQRDVRAMALATIHAMYGDRAAPRRYLAATLASLGSEEPLIRDRWAIALGFVADRLRERGDASRAVTAYRKAIEIRPSQARLHLNLGLAYRDAGRPVESVVAYRESLRLDPRQPLAHINLGIALASSGDAAGATAAYLDALRLNPHEALAHFNLGNVRLRGGDLPGAEESYRGAIAADPSIVLAHVYLARILASRADVRGALRAVEAGLAYDPRNAEGLELRARLLRAASAPR